ncbi:MAG TPA: hypothetical protein ENO09_01230 [bacterium]|nr:hypothetical protein [bacterium]
MKHSKIALAMLALGLTLGSGLSQAETKPSEPTVIIDAVELPLATVTAIDPKTREITLRDNMGETTSIIAGPEVRNFPQIKVGDTLRVRMMQSLLMEVRPHNALVTRTVIEEGVTLAPEGGHPSMAQGRRISTVVTIRALDMKKDFVKFTLPNGEVRTTTAKTTAGKELLHTLKVGDQVAVVFTDAVGILLEPAVIRK